MSAHKIVITALVLCALSDLGAVPLLAGDVSVVLAAGVGVLGVLTLAAAYGVGRDAGWARPLALGTRIVDGVVAAPALVAASGAETAAAAVTVALSVLAIVLVLREGGSSVRTA